MSSKLEKQSNIIIISSAKPRERSAASVTLDRHLLGRKKFQVSTYSSEAREFAVFKPLKMLLDKTRNTRLWKWANDFWFLIEFYLPIHWLVPRPAKDSSRSLVLTVACGYAWITAAKYAEMHGIPLAVKFDDWTPDCGPVQRHLQPFFEKYFRLLHQKAAVSICVSEGMKEELGEGAPRPVVLSIPEEGRPPGPSRLREVPVRVGYLGNMYDYGPMLAELAEAASSHPDIRFEFRGSEPNWPASLKKRMRDSGQLHGFGEGEGFKKWFESFDFYLVAMFFDDQQRRRVRTCFSTKMMEYLSLGRPIIVWAPEESAAVQWAKKTGAASCVTDKSPLAVIQEIERLCADATLCDAIGRKARQAYEGDYSPRVIQDIFESAIEGAIKDGPRRIRRT